MGKQASNIHSVRPASADCTSFQFIIIKLSIIFIIPVICCWYSNAWLSRTEAHLDDRGTFVEHFVSLHCITLLQLQLQLQVIKSVARIDQWRSNNISLIITFRQLCMSFLWIRICLWLCLVDHVPSHSSQFLLVNRLIIIIYACLMIHSFVGFQVIMLWLRVWERKLNIPLQMASRLTFGQRVGIQQCLGKSLCPLYIYN